MTPALIADGGDIAEPWALLANLDHAPHYTVCFAVLEQEAAGLERINSSTTREAVAELTGEIRGSDSIITSLERLTDAGVLEKTAVDDWRGGYDWRTTDRGRRLAEAFVGEWGDVLERTDDD